jgi:transcriptional regulator with XRE-family HTH domain
MKTNKELGAGEHQKNVAARILNLMSEKNVSVVELSAKTGISRSNIYSILKCTVDVRLGTIEKISSALGVPVAHFFGDLPEVEETYQGYIDLLMQKVTILELQVSHYQKEAELIEMRNRFARQDEHGLQMVAEPSMELGSEAGKEDGSQTDENTEDPITQASTMMKDLNRKIMKQKLLILGRKVKEI